MIIIGLTGGIGSGKSTVAKDFKKLKIPVFDSDQEVKKLYTAKDPDLIKAIKKIDKNKNTLGKKRINRKKLGDIVFNDTTKLKILEKVIFKKLKKRREIFLKKNKKLKKDIVVLDTPLLFENNLNKNCNYVVFAKAPLKLRKQRVLKRKGMTKKKLHKIISKQAPEKTKEKKSDFIIQTNKGKWYSFIQIKKSIEKIKKEIKK